MTSNWWGNIFYRWGDVDGEEGGKPLPLPTSTGHGGVTGTGRERPVPLLLLQV